MKNLNRFIIALIVGVVVLGGSAFVDAKKAEHNRKLVNPQWFRYTLDPTASNFNTQKLVPANYTPMGITDPNLDVCTSKSTFCAVYAQTLSAKPDLSTGQPIRTALNTYHNGDGETPALINEEAQ